MTDTEVNKVIAEFMGHEFLRIENDAIMVKARRSYMIDHELFPMYTKSLDALVPVWVKLDEYSECVLGKYSNGRRDEYISFTFQMYNPFHIKVSSKGITIQEAAAHATAKAILELNKG